MRAKHMDDCAETSSNIFSIFGYSRKVNCRGCAKGEKKINGRSAEIALELPNREFRKRLPARSF